LTGDFPSLATESEPRARASSKHAGLHVVHGVLSLDVGGLERIVLDLIRAGRDVGHRMTVLCIEKPGALAAEARLFGARIISFDKPPGRIRSIIPKAAETLRSLQPDVLHTHQCGALWYLGQAAGSLQRLPVIHTEHGNHVATTSGIWRLKTRLFLHQTARFADRFCCVSDEIAQAVTRWHTISHQKVEVVLNGVDVDKFADRAETSAVKNELGIPGNSRVIGTIGRLSEVKRQDLLLRATAKLRESLADIRLLLVGDGPERTRLELEAAALGIRNRVCFAGYRPNPERFLQAMDVFALTSRSEGLPISLLEAWAAGLPVVCSSVGGIPKVIANGEDGLLFPSGDEQALVAALTNLLGDQSFADRLGKSGKRKAIDKYSLQRMANDYNQLYRKLLAAR
jgi:glycosyltransferase involved in cell wall biosynthesis